MCKYWLKIIGLLVMLTACGSPNAELKAKIVQYDATINQAYVTAYGNYHTQYLAGNMAEAYGSVPQFMESQSKASAFWTAVALPSELEGYRKQILDSIHNTMPIEQRYAEYRSGYGAIVTALFPDGSIPAPAPR